MEASASPIERDSQLDIGKLREFLNSSEVRGSDIRRRQQSDGNVTIGECMEGTLETLPAAPLNKADHHEYSVGSRHFAFKLKTEAWFVQRVHQQAGNTEWRGWPFGRASAAVDRAKNLASLIDR